MTAGRGGCLAFAVSVTVAMPLAACSPVDAGQERLCRIALPAIEPEGAAITGIAATAAPGGVRLDYRSTRGGGTAPRFAICSFAPANRMDLVGITTERGEIAGATVYLLKRYYVGSPEGPAGDPGGRP